MMNPQTLVHLQGDLKSLSKANYERMKSVIIKFGFSEPVSVWLNGETPYILNGHQRIRTVIKMMAEEDYFCPLIPVSIVAAKDVAEAKRKLLALASQYGEMDDQGLYEFIELSEISLEELADYNFADLDLDKFQANFYDDTPEVAKEKIAKTCPGCGFEL